MNKYKSFLIEDFLQDAFFQKWVKNPDDQHAKLWKVWLDENPDMIAVVEESKNIILAFTHNPKTISKDFYINLKSRIDSTIAKEKKQNLKVFPRYSWLRLAAVFAGIMLAGSIVFYSFFDKGFTNYYTRYAQTKTVTLPDGSVVILNANSSLKYLVGRITNSREVWLKGEGFFTIKHIENIIGNPVKFIVHANNVDVQVLGTRFNVNAKMSDQTAVLLTTGKVKLSITKENNKTVIMNPNDLVVYKHSTRNLVSTRVNAESYTGWIKHKYSFEKASLADVCKELSYYYGDSFTITDEKMQRQSLSGTLELQDEKTLIQTLSALLNVPVHQNNKEIIIGSKLK